MSVFQCEACGTKLKLPEPFAGRKVRCSKCQAIIEVPAAEEHVQTTPAATKKKKRKKRAKKESADHTRLFLMIGGAAAFLIAAVVVVMVAGQNEDSRNRLQELAIMVPTSMVILIISMLLSSYLAGGMDFGDIRTAIPKGIGLVLVINLIYLLPFGMYLAFPVWVIGLMQLYGLDMWETRFLVGINWIVNVAVSVFVIGVMLHMPEQPEYDEEELQHLAQEFQDLDHLHKLGAKIAADEESDDPAVLEVDLSNTEATDSDMPRLRHFSTLRVLKLNGVAITDAGLAHLKALPHLQTLELRRTNATRAGIDDLQQSLAKTKIIDR